MNNSGGYVRLYRKSHQSDFGPVTEKRAFTRHEAWEDLLFRAVWKPEGQTVLHLNRAPIQLEPGEILTTLEQLRSHWNWGSKDKVKRFITLCASLKMTTVTSTNPLRLNIVNAREYGLVRDDDAMQTATTARRTRDDDATVEEVKKDKNARKKPSGQDTDWDQIIDRWQRLAQAENLPMLRGMSDARKAHYSARVKDNPDFWEVLEREVPILGEKFRQWFNFPWVIKSPDNFAKLAEGNYRGQHRPKPDVNLLGKTVEITGGPGAGARGKVVKHEGSEVTFYDDGGASLTVDQNDVTVVD